MDRKAMAKSLRDEAEKLMQAAAILEGGEGSTRKARKPLSEETKAKMKAAQQARWQKTKKPAKKAPNKQKSGENQ